MDHGDRDCIRAIPTRQSIKQLRSRRAGMERCPIDGIFLANRFKRSLSGQIDRVRPALDDPDSDWHVAAGRWMLEQGVVSPTDGVFHTMPGEPWLVHEWGSELATAIVHEHSGWLGLHLFAALSFTSAVAMVTRFTLTHRQSVHALILTALCPAMTATRFLVRLPVLAWPILASWTLSRPIAAERKPPPSWPLVPLYLLWVNMQGSFTLGVALLVMPVVEPLHGCWSGNVTWATVQGWLVGTLVVSSLAPSRRRAAVAGSDCIPFVDRHRTPASLASPHADGARVPRAQAHALLLAVGTWPTLLHEYEIGWTVFAPTDLALRRLDCLPGFERIHADSIAVANARRREGSMLPPSCRETASTHTAKSRSPRGV